MSGNAFSQICGCIDCPLDIEDQSISEVIYVVAGAENNSLTTNEIETVFIKFRHSRASELQMKLISPAGQEVTLIGALGTAASPTFFGGFNVRFVSDISDTEPDLNMTNVWQNSNLSGLNQYSGAYLPHSGSLLNFNTGTVNGEWVLRISDPVQFDFGILEDFSIQFKDPLGINCCEADAGTIDEPMITSCPGAENLLIDIAPSFAGAAPNSAIYDYTYLVSLDGLLIDVTDQPDLRSASPGTYQIYGLSYELLDILLIPAPNGTLTISSIQNLLDAENSLLCADLTETFLEVNILEGDSETILQDTICQGESVNFGNETLVESGIYRDTFSLSAACDSITILDLFVAQSDITQLTAQTCEPDMVGIDSLFLTNQFTCDSLVITATSLLPNDTLLIQEQTCDPSLAGQSDTLNISTPECDSVLITNLFYEAPDTTFLTLKSCIPNEIGVDTIPINTGGNCDDIQIVQTELYLTDTTFIEAITCDVNAQDPLIELFPTDTCDRVEVTTFIFGSPDTTFLTGSTCEMSMAGVDTLFLTNNSGCDSLIISDIVFTDSDIVNLEQFSCNLEDVGIDTTFLQNENNCDSLVILTTLFSSADTTYLEEITCDINQVAPTEQTFSTETCDSIVVTNFIYSAPDTTFLDVPTCESNQLPDTTILQNQFTCDSIVISTFIFSASDPVEILENTCDINQVGTFADTLSGAFCDSIVITTFVLTMSDTVRTTEVVCAEAEARTDTLFLSNSEGCDSVLLMNFIWEPISPTLMSVFTCDLEQVGFDTMFLTSANNCDSLLINEFIFSNSDTTFLPVVFTCDPAEVATDTTLFATANCDSLVITTTLLSLLDTTYLTESSCDISMEIMDTLIVNTAQGCDSIIITSILPLTSTESFTQTPVADPSQVRLDTMILVNAVGCDSLVITEFFLDENSTSDTIFIDLPTCNPNLMLDTMNTLNGGVVITVPILELIDTTFIQETTCDPEQVASETTTLVTSEGCDSVILVTFDFVMADTIFTTVLTCIEMEQDTFMDLSSECPSIEITTFINQGEDITFIENVSCAGPFGLDTLTLQNVTGCDSLVITSTLEASNSETNIFETTCQPDLANDTLMLSGQFCDSLIITNYIFEAIDPTLISINICDESDLGSDTLTLASATGCDSLVITDKVLFAIDPVELTQSTCDENLIGVSIDTLSSQFGCDSLVRTTFVPSAFQADFDFTVEPPSCADLADASVDILTMEGVSVLWLFDGSESLTRDDLPAGDYMIQLGQGVCDTTVTITIPPSEGLQAAAEVTYTPCSSIGGNIELTPMSGLGPYEYMWADGVEDSVRLDLADGTYTVTVTDALSCSSIFSIEIMNVTGLDVSTDVERVSCFGFADGSIEITLLSGTAPYTQIWSDGNESLFRDSLSAGNYSVTISDVNDCNVTLNRLVQEPDSLALEINISEELEIIVTASGGTSPYTYLWNDGTTTDRIENPISGVEYEVTVTDANGCTEIISEFFQPNAIQDTELKDIIVYPNPSTGLFNLSYDADLHLQEIAVYDIRGRKVLTQSYLDQSVFSELNISHFVQGAYILEVQFAEGVFRDKILIFR